MNEKVWTLITAAGNSSPIFFAAGFQTPKNLILQEGTEIVVRAVNSYAQNTSLTNVALNRDECANWPTENVLKHYFPKIQTERVSPLMPGALVSALMTIGGIPDDSPLVVAAGDSEIAGGISSIVNEFLESGNAAATVAFRASNPRWSYISLNSSGSVRQVAEKRVIGSFATTGVFLFRSTAEFRNAAEWCLVNNARDNNVFYVSTTLNFLIQQGLRVGFYEVPRIAYQSWSLPIDFVQQGGYANESL